MVLRRLVLVCFALFSVFSIFCITSIDDNVPVCNTKKLKRIMCFLGHCSNYFCNRMRLQENTLKSLLGRHAPSGKGWSHNRGSVHSDLVTIFHRTDDWLLNGGWLLNRGLTRVIFFTVLVIIKCC